MKAFTFSSIKRHNVFLCPVCKVTQFTVNQRPVLFVISVSLANSISLFFQVIDKNVVITNLYRISIGTHLFNDESLFTVTFDISQLGYNQSVK